MSLYEDFVQFGSEYVNRTSFEVPNISDNALTVMGNKYLHEGETPADLFLRVAKAVASSINILTEAQQEELQIMFYNMMATQQFMPNSPTLTNAGRSFNQLAGCFVVPVEDSMESIFRHALADMALIQRTGGGTGFDFSRLRPKGTLVSSTQGESSGPISFMQAFNACTETIKQGGVRRGANMGILRIDHPDIEEFITLKSDQTTMTNFNLSVAITDEFMKAEREDADFELKHGGVVYKTVKARYLWDLISETAWRWGEPGLIFIDKINRYNPTPLLGPITATNPCGEQPLLPYEACNLGSINLAACIYDGAFDYEHLKALTRKAVLFLDCVIDAGHYPLPEIQQMAVSNRKIGLGVMGFAEALFKLDIGYDSPQAMSLANDIMRTISQEANEADIMLADALGNFPNIDKSIYKGQARRNAAITTIAPTGTISIIADSSYGIEPYYALSYNKNLTDGGSIVVVNPYVTQYMRKKNFSKELQNSLIKYINTMGTIKGICDTFKDMSKVPVGDLYRMEEIFVCAQDIAPRDHVHIQNAFQQFTDNAVSKTINFDNSASVEDIQNVFRQAYGNACKGITVYRDGCRDSQPLTINKTITSESIETSTTSEVAITTVPKSLKRPTELFGVTRQIETGCGMMLVTANMDNEGNIFEVLMRSGSSGGCAAFTDATARLVSIGLRYGISLETLIDQLRSVRCDNYRYQAGRHNTIKGRSCADAVGIFLNEIKADNVHHPQEVKSVSVTDIRETIQDRKVELLSLALEASRKDEQVINLTLCPECKAPLKHAEGCLVCACGYSKC